MVFLRKFPILKARSAILIATKFQFQFQLEAQLHSCLKPPKANQTLKRYLKSNFATKALLLFRDLMRKAPKTIDSYSFLFVLKVCTQKPDSLLEGKQLHTQVIKFGFESIIQLQTSILVVYASRGDLFVARRLFDEIPSKNIICWTALVSAYVDNQRPKEALQLFRQMLLDNVEPDQVSLTVALSACTDLGILEMGEWIHDYICRKQELNVDINLKNALINMYAKCGDIKTAMRLFASTQDKDVTTWTSMIVGHALNGQAKEALQLFEEMKKCNENMSKKKSNGDQGSSLILPNDVTFIGVLMACSHAGMVEEGKYYFKSMTEEYDLKPRDSHFGCMVDIFCRAGFLKEAYDFIMKMPMQPNAVMWRTLLGSCSLIGDAELGDEIVRKLLALDPGHVGDYIAMSNICAAKGMWDKKMTIREEIKQTRKAPGCSWIEVGSVGIGEFVTADVNHPMKTEIYEVLKHLIECMKAYGQSPELSSPVEH